MKTRDKNSASAAMPVFDRIALRIAKDTLKMNDVFANLMGRPTKAEARATIKRLTGKYPTA